MNRNIVPAKSLCDRVIKCVTEYSDAADVKSRSALVLCSCTIHNPLLFNNEPLRPNFDGQYLEFGGSVRTENEAEIVSQKAT